MNISYNNRSLGNAVNLVTFTDVPNILKITDSNGGSRQTISLVLTGNLYSKSIPEEGWYITIDGETITSVKSYSESINKNFYVSESNESTCASIAKALRNCPSIAANYTVGHGGNEVELVSRENGRFQSEVQTNIGSAYLDVDIDYGSSDSDLYGCKIDVDIVHGQGVGAYVTTLEKNFYNGECAFDLTPVLATFAERGEAEDYWFQISTINQYGVYTLLAISNPNYITQGYMCNQGDKYIEVGGSIKTAQNYSRGSDKPKSNNTILYLYGNTIPFSFYSTTNTVNINVRYLNSAFADVAASENFSYTKSGILGNTEIILDNTKLKNSFYVDIEIGGGDTIRYNVIKPILATEYYQRVYWRNSYGGVSFFDFTGSKSETRNLETRTYQKSIFDYYTDPRNELDKVYDNDVEYTVSLKSHLFENDGKYVFNDLIQSPEVWTVINGEEYAIIVDSCSVEESDKNNVYEATLKYKYSMKPSLI